MYGVFFYLASPYSKYPGGVEAAFNEACVNAAMLMAEGIPIFCPIAHTHPLDAYIPREKSTHAFWMKADRWAVQLAHGIIVLEMDGWQDSLGVRHEIKCFQEALKPIIPMTPRVIPHGLLIRAAAQRSVLGS